MRADAGEDGLFVAFGVYPDGVRRLGAFVVAGGNAGEEVGVFCFEAVLRGAALGMSLSALFVVGSALRLLKKRK